MRLALQSLFEIKVGYIIYAVNRKEHINLIYEKDIWRKEQDRSQIYDKLMEFVKELMEAGRHEKARFRLALSDVFAPINYS